MTAPSGPPRSADALRAAFQDFFAARGHARVPSASLIPHDPTVLFTVAGMVPFKPYFLGDEAPPSPRAVSVQKCARAGGKHNDLDDVGRTKRHLVFFEMLGNFSFGDYFKSDAIPWSWDLVTNVFGFDGDRLWITVHESDDEAEAIWHEQVGVPMSRIQRLGDADNFWQMGETGPCGPCSEIHIDRGPEFGPDGGPLHDPAGDRFLEFWNLVFMQYNQGPDGVRTPLPRPSIDTGAGLERILALVQGVDSVWETDVLAPLVEHAGRLAGAAYRVGDYADRASFSLRVLAEHARSSTMLVSDGVFPSNEGRGYVLRRIIRRAVRHAYLLGTQRPVMPELAGTAIGIMGAAYPELRANEDFITGVLAKEEEGFRRTLTTGLAILEDEIAGGTGGVLGGGSAFLLHDTYGFPLELTQEITQERGMSVDVAAFETEMAAQRARAKAARRAVANDDERVRAYRDVVEAHGTTRFVGYEVDAADATILQVIDGTEEGTVEIFLDVTPFYAESGGQVGDRGSITGDGVEIAVHDTTFAVPGLRRHLGRVVRGVPTPGAAVRAAIDVPARAATRRNHTATHVLHLALRRVLGDHVKQAGSLVAPDRLRFDFSHYAAVGADEIREIERIANEEVLANSDVRAYETSKDEATARGAIAFFGDKYGDVVRVLEAGNSIELCGGTHVAATGDIGLIKIVSEGSIGSNLRRIEAVTGANAVRWAHGVTRVLDEAAGLVGATAGTIVDGVRRAVAELEEAREEIRRLRQEAARAGAADIASRARDGIVVERLDGLAAGDLREVALAVRAAPGMRAVVLVGATTSGGVALVAAVAPGTPGGAGPLIAAAARAVGGGGGGKGDVASAGGKHPERIDEALAMAREAAAALG
ncbi:MAG: alanine--tRNA ligase [Acidimicrobiia bacterium]